MKGSVPPALAREGIFNYPKSIYLQRKPDPWRGLNLEPAADRDAVISRCYTYLMKAVVITHHGGPEVLEVQEVPAPKPGVGEELIHVKSGGVNFADTMSTTGRYPGMPQPPVVAGRQFCGERASNGELVMGYTQWAAFAEIVAARSALLWPLPAGWSPQEGAAFPVNFFTACLAYWKAGLLE